MSDGRPHYVKVTRRHVLARALTVSVLGSAAIGVLALVVQEATGQTRAKSARTIQPPPALIVGEGIEKLPPAVVDMRAEILSAVESGDIADLKRAMDLNELKPEVGAPAGREAIEHLRISSADGKGVSVLLQLGRLLEGKWASIPGGRDIENNRMFVWPHFAEVPLGSLSDAEKAELTKLVGEAAAREIVAQGKWHGWRLSIGADGVWHTYMEIAR